MELAPSHTPKPLGHAYYVISSAPIAAVRAGAKDMDMAAGSSPVLVAVRTVVDSLDKAEGTTEALQLITPLVEMLLSSSDRSTAALLLNALLRRPRSSVKMGMIICDILQKASRKLQLQLVRVCRTVSIDIESTNNESHSETSETRLVGVMCQIAQCIVSLTISSPKTGAIEIGTSPSRLNVEAADASAILMQKIATFVKWKPYDSENVSLYTTTVLPSTLKLLEQLSIWYCIRHRLYSNAIECFAEIIKQCDSESNHETSEDALCASLQLSHSQYLTSTPPSKTATQLTLQFALKKLSKALNAEQSQLNSRSALLSLSGDMSLIGLAIGRLNGENGFVALSETDVPIVDILALLGHEIWNESVSAQTLTKTLLQVVCMHSFEGKLWKLIDLSGISARVRQVVAEVFVRTVIANPEEIAEEFNNILETNNLDVKVKALKLMSVALSPSSVDIVPSKFKEMVSEKLLECFETEEPYVREEIVGSVLSRLPPSLCVGPLCDKLTSKSEKVQSIAEKTLIQMLETAEDRPWLCTTMLDHARQTTTSIQPLHPGDLVSMVTPKTDVNSQESQKRVDKIMQVFGLWSKSANVPLKAWYHTMIPFIIDKVLRAPDDNLWIQFANRVAQRIGKNDCAPYMLASIVKVLEGQPDLEYQINESDNTMDKLLLFQRLSPLLLLRMLPYESFSRECLALTDDKLSSSCESFENHDRLLEAIMIRLENKIESDHVRKVAAELLSRLPPDTILPRILVKLKSEIQRSDLKANLVNAKLMVFVLCSSFMYNFSVATSALTIRPYFSKAIELAISNLKIPLNDKGEVELRKLQQGSIDMLAIVMAISTENGPVSNVENGKATDEIMSLITEEFKVASRVENIQLQICLVNSVISACNHVSRIQVLTKKSTSRLFDEFWRGLAELALQNSAPRLQAACLQALFSFCYQLKGEVALELQAEDLVLICTAILGDNIAVDPLVRTECVKLVGALLSHFAASSSNQNAARVTTLTSLLANVAQK